MGGWVGCLWKMLKEGIAAPDLLARYDLDVCGGDEALALAGLCFFGLPVLAAAAPDCVLGLLVCEVVEPKVAPPCRTGTADSVISLK